jgi:hypothetical protein
MGTDEIGGSQPIGNTRDGPATGGRGGVYCRRDAIPRTWLVHMGSPPIIGCGPTRLRRISPTLSKGLAASGGYWRYCGSDNVSRGSPFAMIENWKADRLPGLPQDSSYNPGRRRLPRENSSAGLRRLSAAEFDRPSPVADGRRALG